MIETHAVDPEQRVVDNNLLGTLKMIGGMFKVKTHTVDPEQPVVDNNLLGTLKMIGGMIMGNLIVTLATLGFVWYTL